MYFMKDFLKGKSLSLIFTGIGALGGFLYWKFVGCVSRFGTGVRCGALQWVIWSVIS
jgi:hypothetical protein